MCIRDSRDAVLFAQFEDSVGHFAARSDFLDQGQVNISLEYGIARFATGQDFLDWVAANKKSVQDFIKQEIIQ